MFNFKTVIYSKLNATTELIGLGREALNSWCLRILVKTNRLTRLVAAYTLALLLPVFTTLTPAFAADGGGTKVKELGNKLIKQLGSYGLTISAIGFVIIVICGLVLITFSGMFNRSWKQKGVQGIMWGGIGLTCLALISFLIPAFFDLVNGLGGDQIDQGITTGGK